MEFEININDEVKVKLTDYGIAILKKRHDEMNRNIESRGGKGFGEFELKQDDEGYTTFQHWILMSTFGYYLENGINMPFETNIIVTKEGE